jgi:hypothetical protein
MSVQTIHIQLPDSIYQRLRQVANATHQSLEAVVVQTICGNLPPSLEDLGPEFRPIVDELQSLNDETLWAIVQEPLPSHQWRRHQRLLRKAQEGPLTEAERHELAALRTATDRYVIRRSYALALLKWRGHTLPTAA